MLEPQFISGRSNWTESLLLNVLSGLPDLTNTNIGHSVKFELTSKTFFSMDMRHVCCMGYNCIKSLFSVYLKFKFN